MYVQKKLMAKMEQERLADLASVQQKQQIDALQTFASLQQMNSAQQQQLAAFLTAAIYNKNLLLNQPSSNSALASDSSDGSSRNTSISLSSSTSNHLNSSVGTNCNGVTNGSTQNGISSNKAKQTTSRTSRKRCISEVDAFSSSEEEAYCYAKLRWVEKVSSKDKRPNDQTGHLF